MAQNLMTPGVYIEEVNAFPGSVVEVATAIPAFIGYTQKASRNGKSLSGVPVRITSLKEYVELFGGGNKPSFDFTPLTGDAQAEPGITIGSNNWGIAYAKNQQLFFYNSIRLFYANGGSTCYIVSVGTFDEKTNQVKVKKDDILGALTSLEKEQEPTMVLVPDAVGLEADACYEIYKQVLAHCAKMQSRVAILDIHKGHEKRIAGEGDIITNFREFIGTEYLDYAAAYYPWLVTNVVQQEEVTFKNLDTTNELKTLEKILPEWPDIQNLVNKYPRPGKGNIAETFEGKAIFLEAMKTEKQNELAKAIRQDKPDPFVAAGVGKFDASKEPQEPPALANDASDADKNDHAELVKAYKTDKKAFDDDQKKYDAALKKIVTTLDVDKFESQGFRKVNALLENFITNKERTLHLGLIATSPTYVNILKEVRSAMNLLPASTAMAGVYTAVDNDRGVWKSPANISLNSVLKPSVNITHDEQKNLNVDAVSGKSVNAIRSFPGRGTLVWGARTLDGNSLDWQYINVRRTIIMLEQSIKLALRAYVFEPNDANTWVTVKSMIVNYLTEKWKQGALAGSTPEDAFDVQIGLGNTMTSLDILEGKMLISVKLAVVRPAEFIVVTFQQQMQKS